MKKSSLVKLSLATVVAAVALSIVPAESSKANTSSACRLRYFNGDKCINTDGNCLPTVVVRPEETK